MPKRVEQIIVKESDAIILKGIAEGTIPSGDSVIKRAKALLLLADGKRIKDVANEVAMRENTITDLRRRYLDIGIECLYDAPKSGRPRSYKPEELEAEIELQLQQCAAEKKPIPSVKELAEKLKAPQNAVREILQEKNVVSERGPRFWRFTMSDGTSPKLADMCGLFLSPGEQALVVKVWTLGKDVTIDLGKITDTIEVVETRTKTIASKMKTLIDESGKVGLADALATFADSGESVRLGKRDSAVSFLKDILPDSIKPSTAEYHVFTCGVSVIENKRSLFPNTYLHVFSTPEEWLSQIEIIVANMYSDAQGNERATKVRNSIYSYLRTGELHVEPFQWIKVDRTAENVEKPSNVEGSTLNGGLTEYAPGTVRFTAEFVNDNHNVVTVRVHANIPISQEEFETENQRGYLNSFNKVEQAIIDASREASRLLNEKYLCEIAKKKNDSTQRMVKLQSEAGILAVPVGGEIGKDMKGSGYLWSNSLLGYMEQGMIENSGRVTNRLLNSLLHRDDSLDAIKLRTMTDLLEEEGTVYYRDQVSWSDRTLEKAGYNLETLLPPVGTIPNHGILDDSVCAMDKEGNPLSMEERHTLIDEAVMRLNEKKPQDERLDIGAEKTYQIEPDANKAVKISMDGVGVKRQKDTRPKGCTTDTTPIFVHDAKEGPEDYTRAPDPKKRPKVETAVGHVEYAGKKYVFAGKNMFDTSKLILAFLISHNLLAGNLLIFFTDGGRDIRY